MPHCDHTCNCKPKVAGAHSDGCRVHKPCLVSVHAEANAIAFAARWGINIEGTKLTTTDSPCLFCSQLIINSGIVSVTYSRAYRDTDPIVLLKSAGIKVKSAADSPVI